jgi:DNA-binding HxlR family transcriptional regulator
LLICLAQKPTFSLRTEHASGWYGISPDTLQRGLDELRDLELIQVWSRPKKAPRARYGITHENFYRLLGPFMRTPQEPIVLGLGEEAKTAAA